MITSVYSVPKAEHAFSMGPTLKLHVVGGGGGGGEGGRGRGRGEGEGGGGGGGLDWRG